MPSTTSSTVSSALFSSTVITPSLPTFCIASERMFPISASLFALIVPTCAISEGSRVGLEIFFSSSTIAATAASIPRLSSIGLWPAATIFRPSRKTACAMTVAVVVPSPATSDVFEATSRSICAPMFSNLSSSSISFATVTPSLVTTGEPKLFSMITFRPFGPSVTFTAFASVLTPRMMASEAFVSNLISLAAMVSAPSAQNGEDVFLAQNDVLLSGQRDFVAGVLPVEDAVADFHVEWSDSTVVLDFALARRHDDALLGLLLRGVGDEQSPGRLLLALRGLEEQSVLQGSDLHGAFSLW